MIEMETRGPAITEDDIERVERSLDIRFPDDYRAFLLDINGGYPADKNVSFPIRKGGSTLHVLYSIGSERATNDLEYETRRGWSDLLYIPEVLIPIGDDSGGDFICLGIADKEAGRVYFRDSERIPDEPPRHPWTRMKGYVRIADSFAEFLASLTPRDP